MKTEIPRNLHHRKPNMGHSCSIIESKAMQSSMYDDNTKRNNEPLYDKKYLLFKFSVMS
jgi:hypothetical protein